MDGSPAELAVLAAVASKAAQGGHSRCELLCVGRCGTAFSDSSFPDAPAGDAGLDNAGKIPLEIIEVQSGGYLAEDDIERFDDTYGRA